MNIRDLVKKSLRIGQKSQGSVGSLPRLKRRSELDIFFTAQFHAKAREWNLTEEHARFVFYEGDTIKENMKAANYKGQEIGIYVFRDRETNQPVITSIWKRQFRNKLEKSSGH